MKKKKESLLFITNQVFLFCHLPNWYLLVHFLKTLLSRKIHIFPSNSFKNLIQQNVLPAGISEKYHCMMFGVRAIFVSPFKAPSSRQCIKSGLVIPVRVVFLVRESSYVIINGPTYCTISRLFSSNLQLNLSQQKHLISAPTKSSADSLWIHK